MTFYHHGAFWLACVFLSGDLCAQAALSGQGVSLPIAVQGEGSGGHDLLSSTNQGNNASRAGLRFRDATYIERASLVSVLDLEEGHQHQAVFKVSSPQAATLRFQMPEAAREVGLSVYGMKVDPEMSGLELSVDLVEQSLTKIQINYRSASMDAPTVLDDVPVVASTRQVFGSDDLGVSDQSAGFHSSLTRPWRSTAHVMLTMDESLNWEIVRQRQSNAQELRHVVMPRRAVAVVVDQHALFEQWEVNPADAVRKLRERLAVSGEPDGMTLFFQLKKGRNLVHDVAMAYQNHRIALAEELRNKALGVAQHQLEEQEALTEAARQRLVEMAERYDIDEKPVIMGDSLEVIDGIIHNSYAETLGDLEKWEQTLEVMEAMDRVESAGRPRAAVSIHELSGSRVAELLPAYQKQALVKQDLVDQGLGPNHPTVREAELKLVRRMAALREEHQRLQMVVKGEINKLRRELILMRARTDNDQAKLLSGDLPKSLTVPYGFVPMYTQAQAGSWPAFEHVIENLAAKTRAAWLKVGGGILALVLIVSLCKRHFAIWRYSGSRARPQYG